ncbi:MAG TPA: hypothetical protein VGP47_04375 [Parachlamydiaceae bacterium]|nr:hypothetical protein [Parachlamydiaceae bacterium]
MKKNIFTDFNNWKNLNASQHFSFYDYIFHQMINGKINSDIYFAFAELFWPTFISFKNYIVVKENFDEQKIENLERENTNVEFWSNLTLTEGYFDQDEDGDEKADSFSQILIETWKAKLFKDFPNHDFIVTSLENQTGDYGLSFYQRKYDGLK